MRAMASLHFQLILAWLVCVGLVAFGAETSLAVSAAYAPRVTWPVGVMDVGVFVEGPGAR